MGVIVDNTVSVVNINLSIDDDKNVMIATLTIPDLCFKDTIEYYVHPSDRTLFPFLDNVSEFLLDKCKDMFIELKKAARDNE